MRSYPASYKSSTLMSLTLHAAIVAAMILGVDFSRSPGPVAAQPAIEAIVVDQSVVERQIERIRERDRAIVEAREREAREAREREQQRLEAKRLERQREQQRIEAERLEHERLAREAEIALERRREEEERQRREAEEAARREQERLAELERQRQEDEARRRREAAEARERERMERELQEALAAEEEQRLARNSAEYDRYRLQIRNRIEANWILPATSQEGVECTVHVTQIPSGDVTSVTFGECNGDAALRRSIETAVLRASPLPLPSIPSLFDREVRLVLRPDQQ